MPVLVVCWCELQWKRLGLGPGRCLRRFVPQLGIPPCERKAEGQPWPPGGPATSIQRSLILGGKDIWDSHGAAAATGDAWLCFNELSQVEEYYSLSGVSPAMSSVLLLLCGEGELRLRNPGQSAIGQSEDGEDEEGPAAVSGTTMSR